MGKIYGFLAPVLLAAAVLAASAGPAHAAAVGAVLGLNRAGISGDAPPDAEYSGTTGLLVGAQGEFGIAPDVLLSLQPMYVRRGSGIRLSDSDGGPQPDSLNVALDYIAVPVVVKIQAGGGRTYVVGGLDLAFLTGATLSGRGSDEDVKDSFASTDVAALLGFGVVFPVGGPRLTVEARYVQGLTNLSGDEDGPIQNLPDRFRSTGLQVTAGVLFSLGRP